MIADDCAMIPEKQVALSLRLNGVTVEGNVEPRMSLLDFVRAQGARGTHASCEHGVCGACTVLLDHLPVRSCLVLAVQAHGHAVDTVESLGDESNPSALQISFSEERALQCGFCTPGFLMLAHGLLNERPDASTEEIREALSSNLCRCTGYDVIVRAVDKVAARHRQGSLS